MSEQRRVKHIISLPRTGKTQVVNGDCNDGEPFVVHDDEKLTAFMGLEAAIRAAPASN
jgi:hypothetical protein